MLNVDDFYIRSGDRRPDLVSTIAPAGGTRNWTGAAWRFKMWPVIHAEPITYKINATADFDPNTLNVSYQFATGDTDTPGLYYGQFEVTYADGRRETFPNVTPHVIRIGR